jgi:type IV secretion system protein VirD4
MAADLTAASRADGTTADGEFWYSLAAKLLAPLLFAAAVSGRSMLDVVRWVDTQEMDEVADVLERAGVPEALQAARATWLREDRQRSSVYTTAESVLDPFSAGAVGSQIADSAHEVDVDALVDGDNTLYVCAPAHDQRRLRALFVTVITQAIDAAFARSARTGRPLDPPLLVVLDEAANIAPLPELDGLAATCAGHGIQLVTVWQDVAQVRARFGERASTVVNNHRAKLFLPGIADPATLELASQLAGDEDYVVPSVTLGPTGDRSTTHATTRRPLLAPDALRRMGSGTGVLLYGALAPVRLRLRPWWEDPELSSRARADGPMSRW